ncbi:hypothetical protein H1R20_g3243, partial [Candolleomyces eurysporus]
MSPPTSQASGEDNAQVLQAIKDCHALEMQIQDMETKLQDLRNTHTAKIGYINKHSTLLSPMSRIPLEIQQYIFEHAVNSSGNSRTRTVLTISSVCGQWRHGALKTSSLWSHISITLPKYPLPHQFYWEREGIEPHQWLDAKINTFDVSEWTAKVQVLLEFAKTFASRSRNYPLTLTFDATKLFAFGGSDEPRVLISSMLDGFSMCVKPLLDVLCGLAPRLRDVDFSLPCATPCTNLLQILGVLNRDRSPQLRNVQVAIDLKDFSVPDYGKIRGAFEAMKRGQNLADSNLYHSYSLSLRSICPEYFSLPIIWSGLTSLTFTSRAADFQLLEEPLDATLIICSLLHNCPNLEHCDFSLPTVSYDDEEPLSLDDNTLDSVISLPRLKTLKIRQISSAPLGFAKILDLPELRELTLTSNPWEPSPRGSNYPLHRPDSESSA